MKDTAFTLYRSDGEVSFSVDLDGFMNVCDSKCNLFCLFTQIFNKSSEKDDLTLKKEEDSDILVIQMDNEAQLTSKDFQIKCVAEKKVECIPFENPAAKIPEMSIVSQSSQSIGKEVCKFSANGEEGSRRLDPNETTHIEKLPKMEDLGISMKRPSKDESESIHFNDEGSGFSMPKHPNGKFEYVALGGAQKQTARDNILLMMSLIASVVVSFATAVVFSLIGGLDLDDATIPAVAASVWTILMYPLLSFVFRVSDSLLFCFIGFLGMIFYLSQILIVTETHATEELIGIVLLEITFQCLIQTTIVWLSYMIPFWSGLCNSSTESLQYAATSAGVGLAITNSIWTSVERINQAPFKSVSILTIILQFIPPIYLNVSTALIGSAYIALIRKRKHGLWMYRFASFFAPFIMIWTFYLGRRFCEMWTLVVVGSFLGIHAVTLQKTLYM